MNKFICLLLVLISPWVKGAENSVVLGVKDLGESHRETQVVKHVKNKVYSASGYEQGDNLGNSIDDVSSFVFKKGLLIGDNINRFAETIGYQKIILKGFPEQCDWPVSDGYEITYSNQKSRDVLYEMLSRRGFDDIRFWELNKTVTATYKGSSSFIKSCLSRKG